MSQRLPVNKFEWIEDTSQFKVDFLKNYKKESEEEYFFEVDINILKNHINFIMIYHI